MNSKRGSGGPVFVHFAESAAGEWTRSQFEVKDVVWDERLGAEKLDLILLDHFADEFQAKHGTDIRQLPKAVAKLKRQVQFTPHLFF